MSRTVTCFSHLLIRYVFYDISLHSVTVKALFWGARMNDLFSDSLASNQCRHVWIRAAPDLINWKPDNWFQRKYSKHAISGRKFCCYHFWDLIHPRENGPFHLHPGGSRPELTWLSAVRSFLCVYITVEKPGLWNGSASRGFDQLEKNERKLKRFNGVSGVKDLENDDSDVIRS